MKEEETFYIKKITPHYTTTVPALEEIVFKPKKYDSMDLDSLIISFFIVKPRLKIGNREVHDITRKDYN
jgi:hypothetical protein